MSLFILFYMLIRWTIPRFRFDQLMALAWKVLIPLALLNLVAVMIVMELGWSLWLLLPVSIAILVGAGFITAQPVKPARTSGARLAAYVAGTFRACARSCERSA